MRFIISVTLLFFAQPSYAETKPSYGEPFDSDAYCPHLANLADFWVRESLETMDLRLSNLYPERRKKFTEDIAEFIDTANKYAGVYSAFCK